VRSPDIRERFLNFFEGRGHHRLKSASLVPQDDPSVLFTVAGMVPLKPYFLGSRTPPAPRATSAQKCFRTADIESVGDASHNTFFEMLGNFSFGDYFKEGAIRLAWELLTGDFELDPEQLWPSVHPGDAEAERLWLEVVGVPRERLCHLDDNWWQPGPTGPCGYDSEVYFDFGPPCSCGRPDCRPDTCSGDRWVEAWNLVFIQFDQDERGGRTPLPKPGVDTGMGLERITAVLQGVRSIYQTDLFVPLIEELVARSHKSGASVQRSLNVLADHLRAATFLIADGVHPSNEGRGYALRRVIRRASVHAGRVGLEGGLSPGVARVVATMGGAYPELEERQGHIERTLRTEEELFARTLAEGTERLEDLLLSGRTELTSGVRATLTLIKGEDAFRLHDTYGFPIELTKELAEERGAEVDMAGFATAMEEQRTRSRAHTERVGFEAAAPALPATTFVGYDNLECEASVVWVGPGAVSAVIEPSPFYAEAGGQVGDRGTLEWPGGKVSVVDTQYLPATDTRRLTLAERVDALQPGMTITARVDAQRRARIMRHHSATHLLHKALKEVLGDQVVQRGSLVEPGHTTFDFNFPRALTADEIREVQHRINEAIRRDLPRTATVMPIAEARAQGAVALFGEKYGEEVRVVDFGGWSKELCGGTHVAHTGEVGAAILISETSIGAGIRRIDMVAGEAAEEYWSENLAALREVATSLRAKPEEVPERVVALQAQIKRLQREVEEAERRALSGGGLGKVAVEDVAGVRLGHLMLNGEGGDVKSAADSLLAERLDGDGVAVVLAERRIAIKVGDGALTRGADANELMRVAVAIADGRGGGSARFASGGIGDPARRSDVLEAVRQTLAAQVGRVS